MKKRFIFSCGDINGIGPEIVIKSLNRLTGKKGKQFIFICPLNVFNETASVTGIRFDFRIVNKLDEISNEPIILFNSGQFKLNTGRPTRSSGKAAYSSLEIAAELLHKKIADALITAPISKEALNTAGYNYPGHTEMLAEWFGAKNYVMMFLSKNIRAALATIHKPISCVPGLITKEKLESICKVIIDSLEKDFGINSPSVGVLGLNPHAGENGLIGHEEEEVIKPFIKNFKHRKYLHGPFSPDAYWGNKIYKNYDLTLGMYHDEILIPFKLLNFSKGVNYTAGLPVVRTSPDHGVAYDIAGRNLANENSIMEAFYYAGMLLTNRER